MTGRPRVVAVIPARGGSRGVPMKNLADVGGRSLVARAVEACREAGLVDHVVVSTDHPAVQVAAERAGAAVIVRPPQLSGDVAGSESAVLHVLDELAPVGDLGPDSGPAPGPDPGTDPEVTVLVQCTSPFIDPADVDAAVARVLAGEADCVFSAVENHAFLWAPGPDGIVGVNHDARSARLRRQDRGPEFRETGAFYVMRTAGLREHGRRFFGTLAVQPVADRHAVEVDTPDDLHVARALAGVGAERPVLDVDAIVTDFDGVHTDDGVLVGQDGTEGVLVSREDGMGVALARSAGIRMLILSTETNPVVTARARKLGIPAVQGLADKARALRRWLDEEGLDPARVAYLGNDVNDLACLHLVGWPVAVANAHPHVRAAARLVLSRRGGSGAVRELCEHVISSVTAPTVWSGQYAGGTRG